MYLYLVDAEVAGGPRRRPTPAGENTSRASDPARLASTRAVERRRQGARGKNLLGALFGPLFFSFLCFFFGF